MNNKPALLSLAAFLLSSFALTACNGAGNGSGIIGGFGNTAYVRVVHGSADAGPVDVQLDGSTIHQDIGYGAVTPYSSLKAGSHTMTLFKTGSDTGAGISTLTFSVNTAQDYTVVIEGEKHPTYQSRGNFGMQAFAEQPFSTPFGGGALNFHNAAPIAPASGGLAMSSVQFGFSVASTQTNNSVGSPVPFGQGTNPQGLPSSALNTPISLYAVNKGSVKAGFTTTPNQINSSCNAVPCGQPNLSLYFVDGPKAATDPTTPPTNVSPTAKAVFFGAFDGNGLLTQ